MQPSLIDIGFVVARFSVSEGHVQRRIQKMFAGRGIALKKEKGSYENTNHSAIDPQAAGKSCESQEKPGAEKQPAAPRRLYTRVHNNA